MPTRLRRAERAGVARRGARRDRVRHGASRGPALPRGIAGLRHRSPDEILELQRCAGNRAVARALDGPAAERVQRNGNPFGSATPSPDERGKPQKPEQWVELQEMTGSAPTEETSETAETTESEAEADKGTQGPSVKLGGATYGYDPEKGAYVSGLTLFEGGPTVDFSRDKQKVAYDVPGTDWSFPPPKGDWKGPAFKAQIPLGPHPFGIEVGGSISGGVKLSKLGFTAEHEREGKAEDAVVTNKATFTGETSFKAKIGGNFDLGVWGGVPQVATLSAGGRVSSNIEADVTGTVTGMITQKHTNPGAGVQPRELDRRGQIDFSLTGAGVLQGALKAYFAGQILMHEHDFYELTVASADVARVDAGARMGRRWKGIGAEGENFLEPVKDGKYLDVSFLLQDALNARKVDKAKEAVVRSQADVAAYQDLQQFLATGSRQMALPGEVAVLRNKADQLLGAWTAANEDIDKAAADLVTVENLLGTSGPGAQIQVGQDMVALSERRAQLVAARKAALARRAKKEKELMAVNERTTAEMDKFYKNLDLDSISAALAKAKAAQSAAQDKLLGIYRDKLKELLDKTSREMNDLQDEMRSLRGQMGRIEGLIEKESGKPEKAAYESALEAVSEEYDKLALKHKLAGEKYTASKKKLDEEFRELATQSS